MATTTTNGLTNGQSDGRASPLLPAKPLASPPSPAGTKRKRSPETHAAGPSPSTRVFADLFELLQKHDPSPSVLHVTLTNASRLSKRPKTDDSGPPATLVARLQDDLYTSLDELDHDLADACQALLEPIHAKDRLKNGQRLSVQDIKTMQRVSDFHQLVKGFVDRERRTLDPQKDMVKKEPPSENDPAASTQAKTVLTLFGNAPNPKQLFSSLQKQNNSIDGTNVSLEELGLPNMLAATKVVPLRPEDALGERKPDPTFADIFPAPTSLPPLNPPKPSKHSSSKSSTISWSLGELSKPSRKAGYTLQPLTVGSWIGYGGVESRESVSAIKRRRRESLLSNPDLPKPSDELSTADALAQEAALFRQAYSSFAPTQDNSKALVPQETKHKVWWHRLGQKRFEKHFVLDPALEEAAFPPELERSAKEAIEEEAAAAAIGGAEDLKEIEKAIEDYDDEVFKDSIDLVTTINEAEREVDQMLVDISQLLKSLSSHQRIRNSYIAAGSRNPASPSPMLSAMVGTSTTPSAEETETYKALRSQLAQMISGLPPYAVAKLDGEQLEDLAISKNIVIQGKEYQGTMEEDSLTRTIRNAQQSSQASSTLARTASGTDHSTSAGHFGRTPSVSSRSAHAPNSHYNSRTPAATGYARTGASQPFNAPATAPRQTYTNSYSSSASAARPSTFTQPSSQFYSRANYGAQYGAVSTPQAPANPGRSSYASVPQTAFAPRTSTFAPSAQTYTPQANYSAPRPSYAASGATPGYAPRPQAYAQTGTGRQTPTFAPSQQPQPQPQQQQSNTPSAVGPSGFHSTLTSEQQQLMMERQRAALARQGAGSAGGGPAPPAPMNGGA